MILTMLSYTNPEPPHAFAMTNGRETIRVVAERGNSDMFKLFVADAQDQPTSPPVGFSVTTSAGKPALSLEHTYCLVYFDDYVVEWGAARMELKENRAQLVVANEHVKKA